MKIVRKDSIPLYLGILMASLIPFSITLTYIPLILITLWMLINFKGPAKDFLWIILLYVWRGITIILNGGDIIKLKDIFDKFGYPAFSNFRIDKSEYIIYSFALSTSLLVIIGLILNLLTDKNPMFINITSDFVGFYGHKHHSGALFSFSSILFAALTCFNSLFYVIPLILSLVGLFMTKSHIYIFFTSLSVVLILSLRFKYTDRFPHFILSMLPLIFAIYYGSIYSPKFMWSFEKRLNYLKIGLEIFQEHKIVGVGYSSISQYLERYLKEGLIDNPCHLHNTYLNSFAETGFVGGILMIFIGLYFIFKYLFLYLRRKEQVMFLVLALSWTVYSFAGLFENNFDNTVLNFVLYFFMGIFTI